MTKHGKCTLTPKNVPNRCPIVAFSFRYEMKIVSVILLQIKFLFCSVHIITKPKTGSVCNV